MLTLRILEGFNVTEHDLLTIKEFSIRTGIKESTLRHYDNISLFQPIMRGANGYRYYSAAQTTAVNLIIVLSSLGIPLKTICELQKNRTPKLMLDLLHKQELELNRELFRLQQAYAVIHTYRELIQKGLLVDELTISDQWMDEMPISLGPVNDFSSGFFYDSYFSFLDLMTDGNMDAVYPTGGFYESFDGFAGSPGQPSSFFLLAPTGKCSREAGEYLVGYARGYYGNLGDLPERMQAHMQEHGLAPIGPVYEIYYHDEVSVSDPDRYLIQVSARVKRRR